ncbi:tetratricopeptide repeat protein [Hyphomicrobium sp. D-2]|uniref:tetratricopeptide repeat protein n=1 Tax=Hyphomicrobium sp. D-2 TaxID=3041621 RepID=UPI00245754E8|nr:tetratricopeptide repeat protein [Hyphomicrobium sp. D-2]MDH4982258.1 tetratricopeptide repeat protein [Hyphomicrobium sp. D-2]
MRTFDRTVCTLLTGAMLCLGAIGAWAAPAKYTSPQDALDQGIGAFQGGYYEMAVDALQHAAQSNMFLAPYYLARIYADNNGSRTDHAKAYELYLKIAEEHTDVDPDDDRRAPYVAKAMTRIAGYLLTGLPEANLKANPKIAMEYLREAAQFFRDEDAQFELAKLYLHGDVIESDVPYARHWLSVLSQKGHPGAQAYLADMLWRGKYMKADPVRALALISVAVSSAPTYERLWIEDIYQNIYCGAPNGVRRQATGLVADWRTRYGRKPDMRDDIGLGLLNVQPTRACGNGEMVVFDMEAQQEQLSADQPATAVVQPPATTGTVSASTPPAVPAALPAAVTPPGSGATFMGASAGGMLEAGAKSVDAHDVGASASVSGAATAR